MWRTFLVYGLILAGATLALDLLQYRFLIRTYPVEAYVIILAVGFMALGIWVGARLFRRPPAAPFEINLQARESLGISDREFEVLEHLAAGRSNKEIAGRLEVSPNTVKTHIANLFEKLGARRRTEAILRARELGMIR